MTTRPATPMPDWATDATYTSGPDTGIATKLEPVAGEFAPGFWRTYKPSARKLNWWMNKVGARTRAIFPRESKLLMSSGPITGRTVPATSLAEVKAASRTTPPHGRRDARSTATAVPSDSPCTMTCSGRLFFMRY